MSLRCRQYLFELEDRFMRSELSEGASSVMKKMKPGMYVSFTSGGHGPTARYLASLSMFGITTVSGNKIEGKDIHRGDKVTMEYKPGKGSFLVRMGSGRSQEVLPMMIRVTDK